MLRPSFRSFLFFAAAAVAASAQEPPVQLTTAEPFGPKSTFELRFGQEMITADQFGKPADPSPVVLHPQVAGQFVWVSTRSGVFTPAEPYPLGTTLQVSLHPEFKPVRAGAWMSEWRAFVHPPPFSLTAWSSLSHLEENDASAEPKLVLLFNAEVSAASAAEHVWFTRSGADRPVAARITAPEAKRPGLTYFGHWTGNQRSLLTWAERFRGEQLPPGARPNQLFVTPARPLPPGEKWRLLVKAGLPSRDADLRLLTTVEIPIGTVQPFAVREVAASNELGEGRRLRVLLNKALPPDMRPDALARWASVTPAPAGLTVTAGGGVIEYRGEFDLDKTYRVAIEPGLPAQEPFVLAGGVIREVRFEPIPSGIFLPAFETHQMKAGRRQFHLRAVNVPRIRVSAKLFTGNTVPLALRRFDAYYGTPQKTDGGDAGDFTRIDTEKLPGRTIWQKEMAATQESDKLQEVALDWNEIVGEHRSGVVLLTAEQAGVSADGKTQCGAQALIQLTDLGAVWKRAPGETLVHVFSMQTGHAVPGAKLRLLGPKDEPLGSGTTDQHGLARLPAPEQATLIEVRTDDDAHLIAFKNGSFGIDLARVDVQFDHEGEDLSANRLRAMLLTERGVYQPGEIVHLKGIVRDWSAGKSRIPAGTKGRVVVTDARDREFATRTITVSEHGSFAEDIQLPAGVVGTFNASIRFGKLGEDESAAGTHDFEVQEYRPNTFEVAIGQPPPLPGPVRLALPVTAKYYMGKPLSKAQLAWSIDAHDIPFSPEGFEDFQFAHGIHDYRLNRELGRLSHFADQGKAALDAQGSATIEASVPLNPKAPQPRSIRILSEVTDLDQQTVSETKRFTQHSSDFYLGVREFRSLTHEGEPLALEVIAVRTDGTPAPEPIAVSLELTRIDWETNRVQRAGAATEYENEPRLELVARRDLQTSPLTKQGRKWVAKAMDDPLVAGEPGQYLLQLRARDAAGREVVTTTTFQVYGPGATAWDYRNPYQIELVPDKDDYLAGETATILVKTPISGDALVTIERENVRRTFPVRLEGNAPAISVPLESGDAPNLFVSVMLLRGADDSPRQFKVPEYRIGYCELAVTRPESKLTVYVRPEAKAYQPGQSVAVNLEVLDFQGQGVRNAEVTLYAVDEGVLSITGYVTPDPLAFFNEKRPLTVSTGLTLPTLLEEDPEKRDYGNKGYLIGGGGEADDGLRKNFLACAFWAATLRTDAHGKLTARFPAPDSLTRYRVMAVVQTTADQFGSGESSFEVNKPVMLAPALPRFANVGDQLLLRAVLHNTTALDGETDIALTLDGTARAAATTRKVALPAHSSLAVDFPVEFIETGKARWKWSAHFRGSDGTEFRDLVQSELNVGYPAPLLREVRTLRVSRSEGDVLAGIDPRILEGRGRLRVSLTNSRAIELQESLRQLLHYPYGCVEQTTSSTLPWLVLRGFRDLLPSLKRTDEEVATAVDRGVNRLLAMQTDTGGLAYWPGESEPMLWGSAYGSIALTLAKQRGFVVPEAAYDSLLKWMGEQLRGTGAAPGADLHPRCLALYALALAGRAEPAYGELLFQRRGELGSDDRALLALAVIENKGAAATIDELLKPSPKRFAETWFGIAARSTALELLAWGGHRPQAGRVEELAAHLFEERRGGHWWTTQGNAWGLLAMSDYLQRVETANQALSGRVRWGTQTREFSLGAKPETATRELPITSEARRTRLQIEKSAGGTLFAEIAIESYPKLGAQPAQDRGYALRRRYAKVEDDGTLSEAKELRVGDRVLVTLDLEVRKAATYLAVEDLLPANLEAVNPAFKSQATRAGEKLGTDWMSDFRELREDRALFFTNQIAAGNYTLRYLARCSAAGMATAPAAKVEEMYHPERFGLTESIQLSSRSLE